MSTGPHGELTHRHYALLRAVAAGHCELSCSCEPDLYIDGRTCCDQQAAHFLAHAGLISHAVAGPIGQRVPAVITDAGRALLAAMGEPVVPSVPARRQPTTASPSRPAVRRSLADAA